MNKIALVYWSGMGSTEQMARAIAKGARDADAQADVYFADYFDAKLMDSYDVIAFGCPAMGCEQLEEEVFEPLFSACEGKLRGKKAALFGSYGFGGGKWMRAWHERCAAQGVLFAAEDLIVLNAPDSEGTDRCRRWGAALAVA